MSGALIQLLSNETFQERNEVIGLELGIVVFSVAVLAWLIFIPRKA
jgi:hypothetical protein